MATPPFGFQGQLDPNLLSQLAQVGKTTGWGPVIDKLLGGYQSGHQQGQEAFQQKQQQQGQQDLMSLFQSQQPQQGPQMPPQQGPQMPGQSFAPPASGMGAPPPKIDPNTLMAALLKANPQLGQKTVADELSNVIGGGGPLEQSQIAKNAAETAALQAKPGEQQAALDEKKAEAAANRQIRQMQVQMNMLLAQGKHEEALAKLEQTKAAIAQRAADAAAARKLKAESENAKYPIQNLIRKVRGQGPVVSVPGDQDMSNMSDEQLKKIASGQ